MLLFVLVEAAHLGAGIIHVYDLQDENGGNALLSEDALVRFMALPDIAALQQKMKHPRWIFRRDSSGRTTIRLKVMQINDPNHHQVGSRFMIHSEQW